jgi:hypothetical protein
MERMNPRRHLSLPFSERRLLLMLLDLVALNLLSVYWTTTSICHIVIQERQA